MDMSLATASFSPPSFSLSRWNMSSLRSSFTPTSFRLSSSPSPVSLRSSVKANGIFSSFFGLPTVSHTPVSDTTHSGQNFLGGITRGFKILAMRHGRKVPKLNRPPDQRKALIRGLTTQVLKHGRIKTTMPRAKAIRKYVDKMITWAKDGSLHKRRLALGFIYEKNVVHALFAEAQERYGDRNGGYTRVIRDLPRKGDAAPMSYVELV